jgi:2-keto-3-deoxy-L-rhamnonate aldolase RhmA
LERGPCFGPFLKLPRPEVVDLLALAGFDFVIVDMEHGQISEPEARTVIAECALAGLPAVVRLADAAPGIVNRLLEAGAVGIQMPKVRTVAEAMGLRAMMQFPPAGIRSIGIANRWARYGRLPLGQVVDEANRRSVAIGMFETREVEQPWDDVLAPLDVVFIGPGDLSIEYGRPLDDPEVQAHIARAEDAARRTGTMLGRHAAGAEQAAALAARGYRFIGVSADTTLLGDAATALVEGIRAAVQATPDTPTAGRDA